MLWGPIEASQNAPSLADEFKDILPAPDEDMLPAPTHSFKPYKKHQKARGKF